MGHGSQQCNLRKNEVRVTKEAIDAYEYIYMTQISVLQRCLK